VYIFLSQYLSIYFYIGDLGSLTDFYKAETYKLNDLFLHLLFFLWLWAFCNLFSNGIFSLCALGHSYLEAYEQELQLSESEELWDIHELEEDSNFKSSILDTSFHVLSKLRSLF